MRRTKHRPPLVTPKTGRRNSDAFSIWSRTNVVSQNSVAFRKAKVRHSSEAASWTEEEDEALRKVVERDGPRDWATMAQRVGSTRTASALR